MTFMSLLTALPALVVIALVAALFYYGYEALSESVHHRHTHHH